MLSQSRDRACELLDLISRAEPECFTTFDDGVERKKERARSRLEARRRGELMGKIPDPFARQLFGSLDQCWSDLVEMNQQGAGCFLCVNPTNAKGRNLDDIIGVRACWADDPLPGLVKAFKLKALVVETSPHKFQAWWPLRDCPLNLLPSLWALLRERVHGDKSAGGVNRVLRLAGTFHQKDPAKPFLARVVQRIERGTKYSLEEMCDALGTAPDALRSEETTKRYSSGGRRGAIAIRRIDDPDAKPEDIKLDPDASLDPVLLNALQANLPRFRPTWQMQNPLLQKQSPSEYRFSLIDFGCWWGLTDQQIVDLVMQWARERELVDQIAKLYARPELLAGDIWKARRDVGERAKIKAGGNVNAA